MAKMDDTVWKKGPMYQGEVGSHRPHRLDSLLRLGGTRTRRMTSPTRRLTDDPPPAPEEGWIWLKNCRRAELQEQVQQILEERGVIRLRIGYPKSMGSLVVRRLLQARVVGIYEVPQ